LSLPWLIHHIFLPVAPWVWCMSYFDLFFKICGHIVRGHVPSSISRLFFAYQFLTLEKQSRCIHPITIGEVTYHLVAQTLIIQFKDSLAKHFNLHQFSVMTYSECEAVVHNI
jgi:hypothetical protein